MAILHPVGHKGSTAKTTCVVSVSLTTATPHLPQTDNNPELITDRYDTETKLKPSQRRPDPKYVLLN